ncbi:hypothetical protein BT63DRAFT_411447 [Microthyrium microscopicum]|uniref:Uncharacterized protein n=1 Tax=Microthyrium microscopicum TaxID=703497 RepID=A0A6A6UIW6_9PEZI|nr:hypothetical protein BT63DRAFT_411447 [Microthyrium microscopicum]
MAYSGLTEASWFFPESGGKSLWRRRPTQPRKIRQYGKWMILPRQTEALSKINLKSLVGWMSGAVWRQASDPSRLLIREAEPYHFIIVFRLGGADRPSFRHKVVRERIALRKSANSKFNPQQPYLFPLLKLNKQIHEEASSILYEQKFKFASPDVAVNFLFMINSNRKFLGHVTWDPDPGSDCSLWHQEQDMKNVFKIKRQRTGNESVQNAKILAQDWIIRRIY